MSGHCQRYASSSVLAAMQINYVDSSIYFLLFNFSFYGIISATQTENDGGHVADKQRFASNVRTSDGRISIVAHSGADINDLLKSSVEMSMANGYGQNNFISIGHGHGLDEPRKMKQNENVSPPILLVRQRHEFDRENPHSNTYLPN